MLWENFFDIYVCRRLFFRRRRLLRHRRRHRNEAHARCRKRLGNARIQRCHLGICSFFNNERRLGVV